MFSKFLRLMISTSTFSEIGRKKIMALEFGMDLFFEPGSTWKAVWVKWVKVTLLWWTLMSGSDYDLLHFTSLDCIELSVIFAVAVASLQSVGKISSTLCPPVVFFMCWSPMRGTRYFACFPYKMQNEVFHLVRLHSIDCVCWKQRPVAFAQNRCLIQQSR